MKVTRTPPTPLLRLDPERPEELLGLIPYLIGFRPEESLVVLLFTERKLLVAARLDLEPAHRAADQAEYVRALAVANNAAGAIVVAISARFVPAVELLDRWVEAWARLEAGQRRDGCPLLDALYADGRRWWSRSTAAGRARVAGTPYDPQSSKAAATAVLAGLPALGSRAELAARVAAPAVTDRPALAALAARTVRDLDPLDRPARQSLMASSVTEGLTGDPQDADCARLAVLSADLAVRDLAWSMITSEGADDHVDLWSRVARRTSGRTALGPLGLTGVAAWIAGHGALMNCCIERGERIDADYSMIGLLSEIGLRGIPPSVWRELGPAIRTEVGRPEAGGFSPR